MLDSAPFPTVVLPWVGVLLVLDPFFIRCNLAVGHGAPFEHARVHFQAIPAPAPEEGREDEDVLHLRLQDLCAFPKFGRIVEGWEELDVFISHTVLLE